MKTYEQIVRQLRMMSFPEEEWLKVKNFCHELGYKVQRCALAKIQSTYEEFAEWYANGFGSGDIVRYGRTVAVLSYKLGDRMVFCAYFDMNDRYIDLKGELYHAKNSECCHLSPEESARYSYIMRSDGYRVDVLHGLTYRLGNVVPGGMYRFVYSGKEYVGPAISSGKDGISFPYRYSEDEFVVERITVPYSDMDVKLSRPTATQIKKNVQKRYFCSWNPQKHRMDYSSKRVDKGKRYYYISDKFTITATAENMSPLSNGRYENGNYFTSMEEAMAFLKTIKEIRIKMIRKEK